MNRLEEMAYFRLHSARVCLQIGGESSKHVVPLWLHFRTDQKEDRFTHCNLVARPSPRTVWKDLRPKGGSTQLIGGKWFSAIDLDRVPR